MMTSEDIRHLIALRDKPSTSIKEGQAISEALAECNKLGKLCGEALAVIHEYVAVEDKCDYCDQPATRTGGGDCRCDWHTEHHDCDSVVRVAPEHARAAPLRRALALLARHGGSK